jgi:hypothetical protein
MKSWALWIGYDAEMGYATAVIWRYREVWKAVREVLKAHPL